MQFKKETALSSRFQSRLKHIDAVVPDILETSQSYAVIEDGQIIKRFKVVLGSSYYAIPYAMLPILIYQNGKLIIKAYGMHIEIEGRNTQIIEQLISEERLIFVKMSAGNVDVGDGDVFIEAIKVSGKSVSEEMSEEEL